MSELVPASWIVTSLEEICDINMGQSPPSSTYNEDGKGIPFFQGKAEFGDLFPTPRKWCTEPSKRAKAGDILLSVRAPVGPTNVAPMDCCIGRGLAAVSASSEISQRFVLYALRKSQHELASMGTGSTFGAVSGSVVRRFRLPLAPASEQARIASKIDELLSDLDAGVAALDRARANLKRYRVAVLKAAVDGWLTEKWRAAHPKIEPAEKLLGRILIERRKKWEEAQVKMYAEKGQSLPRGWKDRYPEPLKPDVASLPALPSGWTWTSMEQLIVEGPQNGLYLPKEKYGAGIPILRIDDYQNDSSRASSELRQVRASIEERGTYALHVGDILVNRVNSPSHLGKCIAIQERHVPALFESNMMRFAVSSLVRPDFVVEYLRSFHGRARLTCNAKWAVNQASINQQDVLKTPVPLPSRAEQAAVLEEIEHRISVTTASELEARASITRSARLRQSILKRAFEGKLVPQDPKDEPASELLARIRHARAGQAEGGGGGRKIRKKIRKNAR